MKTISYKAVQMIHESKNREISVVGIIRMRLDEYFKNIRKIEKLSNTTGTSKEVLIRDALRIFQC
jgi:thiamine pyrophosphokinase